MKKIILCLCLLFSLIGCQASEPLDEDTTSKDTTIALEEDSSTSDETANTEDDDKEEDDTANAANEDNDDSDDEDNEETIEVEEGDKKPTSSASQSSNSTSHKSKISSQSSGNSEKSQSSTSASSHKSTTSSSSSSTKKSTSTKKDSASSSSSSSSSETKSEKLTCLVTVDCANIYNHIEDLQSNYQIPSNGIIYSQTMEFEEGDSVLDLLKKTGLTIDVAGGYVKGIDNLYEFDCGTESGWTYSVNGVKPNVGASQYKASQDDKIIWKYLVRRSEW